MGGVDVAVVAAAVAGASLISQGVTTLRSAEMQRTAGKIIEIESETDAQQIELAAAQREVDRKQELSKAISSQIASYGIKGISAFEGSPLTILQADLDAEKTATERDEFMARMAALTTRTRGYLAKQAGKTGAGLSMIQGLASLTSQTSDLLQTMPDYRNQKNNEPIQSKN